MKRLILCCLAMATALMGNARGEIVQGEEWHPVTQSTSPTEDYLLVFLKVKDSEVAPRPADDPRPGPGDAISLYLVRRDPHEVITEIDPNFRCYRNQKSRFNTYWSEDGTKVAVVFDHHVDSSLAVLQKNSTGWHKLALPYFNWVTEFKAVAKAHHLEAQTMKGFIERVSFQGANIVTHYSGSVDGTPRPLNVSFTVQYRPTKSHWTMHVGSAHAESVE